MKNLSHILLAFGLLFTTVISYAQTDSLILPYYHGIVVSPFIDVVLIKGKKEGVRLEYSGIEKSKINAYVKADKLHLYLTDARFLPKRNKYRINGNSYSESIYKDAKVVAYISYVELDYIEQRGDRTLICEDTLSANKLIIELYGRTHADIASIKTEELKIALYGENYLNINTGFAAWQKYNAYGENKVNAENLQSDKINTTSFGESRFTFRASDKITISTFGESKIYFSGLANIQRGIVIGNNTIIRTEE